MGFPLIIDTRLCVDVFPLYSLPDNDTHAEKMLRKSRELKNILRNASLYKPSKEFISAAHDLVEMWEKISYKPSKRVMRDCVESPGYYEEEIVSYEAYEKAVDKEFCGEMFSVPVGYDEILRTLYKDYMKLPPEEKRVPQNNYFFIGKRCRRGYMNITILGGGNIGMCLVGEISRIKGYDVTLYASKPEMFSETIQVIDDDKKISYRSGIFVTTDNLRQAICNADIILCTLPAFLRKNVVEEMEDCIKEGAFLGFSRVWRSRVLLSEAF